MGMVLSGCGSISLVKPSPAADIYDLSISPVTTDDLAAVDWQLVVEEPLAPRALNTDRIMIRTSPHVIKYVASSRWSERSADLLHTHLIKSFEDTNKILSVGREVSGLRRDYELKSEMRSFHIEDFGGRPIVSVEVSFKLVEYPSAKVIDAEVFSRKVEISSLRMSKVVAGFDQAVSEVLNEVVHWVFANGEGNAPTVLMSDLSTEMSDSTPQE
jgi:cholesterol transport system auxiliary component